MTEDINMTFSDIIIDAEMVAYLVTCLLLLSLLAVAYLASKLVEIITKRDKEQAILDTYIANRILAEATRKAESESIRSTK
jgi:uncharacterized membrane protein (UPF0182 family)